MLYMVINMNIIIYKLFNCHRIHDRFTYNCVNSQCLLSIAQSRSDHKCFDIHRFPKDILNIIISFLEAEELVHCENMYKPDWNNLLKYFFQKYDVPYIQRKRANMVLYDTIVHGKCIICSSKIHRYPLCHICFGKYMIEDDDVSIFRTILICYPPILLLTIVIFDYMF